MYKRFHIVQERSGQIKKICRKRIVLYSRRKKSLIKKIFFNNDADTRKGPTEFMQGSKIDSLEQIIHVTKIVYFFNEKYAIQKDMGSLKQ